MTIRIPPAPKEATAKLSKPSFTTSRLLNVVLFLVAAGLGLVLTFTATDERDRADANATTALTLADQIQAACQAGTIPPDYAYVCEQAAEAQEKVTETQQGPQGLQGNQGIPGPQGIPGEKGDKGDPGVAGPQGIQGIPGANGQDGQPGIDGQDGQDGAAGPQGIPGADGEDGDPPLGWTTVRADGSVEECSRVDEFDPNNPLYNCEVISEPTDPALPPEEETTG